ncbi:MAG: hypothetical protein GY903_29900 [Fuerstiella sp.]|nr:hypothetical protein [Fuerstiella sp.]
MLSRPKIRMLLMLGCLSVIPFELAVAFDETTLSATERLRRDQEAVSGRYSRFERLLSQMADMLGHEDPERAELLRRAISKGREQAISANLDEIAESLEAGKFGPAAEKQVGVTASLRTLLKLLQSEDRRSAVEKDRERLNNLLKDVHNTMAEQRAARGVAQNSKAPSNAAPDQQRASDHAEKILKEMKQHDDAEAGAAQSENEKSDSDSKSGEPKDKSSDGGEKSEGDPDKDADADPKDGEKSDKEPGKQSSDPSDPSQGQPNEKPSDQNGKGESQPSDSDSKSQNPSQSKSGESSKSQDGEQPEQTPGRKQMETARQLMQEALDQLQEQQREKAVDKQDSAIAELQKAANELEEMLRQLREEEKEMILAALEARFQRMLALQTLIHEGTLDLSATPREQWADNAVSLCRDLSQQQADLTQECRQTTGLLREDGTSVSILVAVEDIEFDMGSVAARLQETKVGAFTQSMQTDVIEGLKELIEATQREMEDMKSEERQQQQQQAKSQKKPPLVQLMAEIRVLRSLQLRVNRRTRQIHELSQDASADDHEDLSPDLRELAVRQDRLRESAAELAKRMEQQR